MPIMEETKIKEALIRSFLNKNPTRPETATKPKIYLVRTHKAQA